MDPVVALSVVVMAAGQGTRMKSEVSKVLHPAAGRPLVYYPVKAALDLGATEIVVVVNPNNAAAVESALARELSGAPLRFAVQSVPRGTGDAVRAALPSLSGSGPVLVLSGDTPLVTKDDLLPLVALVEGGAVLGFSTFVLDRPGAYGRVLRDAAGRVTEIREARDLRNDAERAVREVNAGVYLALREPLERALGTLTSDNAQGEYYLTDVVSILAASGRVETFVADPAALAGVNDRAELASAERALFERIRLRLGRSGVSIVGAPLIDDGVVIEPDARIEDGARLRGRTRVGARTTIDVSVVLDDAVIGADTVIKPHTVVSRSEVGSFVQLGPFAHLRPGSVIEDEAHVGNFVETKQARLRRGAKANHLAYLGDADVGEKANVGAGTIVCNYDGFQKQRTVIGKGAFIGSDSQLIAPVTIGDGAYVATGTTVTRDVPADALAIGRTKQSNKEGYGPLLRDKLRAAAERAKAKKA